MNYLETILWGMLGALGMELAVLYRLCRSGKLPSRYTSMFFWLIRGVVIACGGAVALAYSLSGLTISSLLAANLGAATPLLLAELIQLAPQPGPEVPQSAERADKSEIAPRSQLSESSLPSHSR
jgi:hypothetical protein